MVAKRTGPKNSRRKGKRAKINREERPKVSRIAALTDRDILYAGLATLTDREVQELGASLLSAHSPESLWVGLAIRFLETRGILSPDSVLLPDNPEIAKAKLTTLIDRELQVHPDFILSLFRSEEHTSELQSLRHLVCRLLLEKKTQEAKRSTPARSQEPPAGLQALRQLT